MSRASLSLCMIIKDEEHFLRTCLEAASPYVDEIIVVDTGSSDRSKAIAADFTDRIYDFDWCDDFARARNFSLQQAGCDWILVLDADEIIAPEDLQRIRDTIDDTDYDAFFLIQYNYDNNPQVRDWQPVKWPDQYSGDYIGYRRNPIARLFRNRPDIHYSGKVHETIDSSIGNVPFTVLEIPIHHDMDSDPSKPREARLFNYLHMIEKALAEVPDGRLFACAAAIYMYNKHDYGRAAEYFQRAADMGYKADQNRESVAEALYRGGELEGATECYQMLYDRGYKSFNLCNNLANLRVKRGEILPAIDLLKLALGMREPGDEIYDRLQHNIRYLESQVH